MGRHYYIATLSKKWSSDSEKGEETEKEEKKENVLKRRQEIKGRIKEK